MPRSRDCRDWGGLSFVTLAEAGWVLLLPLGLLGKYSVAQFAVGQVADVSFSHSARMATGSGSTAATDSQTPSSAAPEIQVMLKAALTLGCLALGSSQAF